MVCYLRDANLRPRNHLMLISVAIPVFNEERTLDEIVAKVLATPHEKEVLLVDDGSSDRSGEMISALAERHAEVRAFRHDKNRGKGAALATALRHVRGEVVIIQDADLEYDPADYDVLLRPILEGKADVVYGSRFQGGAYSRVHLFWHYVGNRLLTSLSNLFTNLNLSDMETCYKVFTAEIGSKLDLRSKSFAVEPEITAKVARMKARIYEVPISYAGRDYEEGKKIGPRDALIAIAAILRWGLFR